MKFKLGGKTVVYEGRFMKVWSTEWFDAAGKPQVWEYVEQRDVVLVLPVTDDQKAVLIKTYRIPIERYVIENPAGLVDKKGENMEDAIKRELLEEVGYAAANIHALPPYPARPGVSKNMFYPFIATGLKKVADNTGDDTEDISIMEIPLNKLFDLWLHPADDTFIQPDVLAMYQAGVELGILPRQ